MKNDKVTHKSSLVKTQFTVTLVEYLVDPAEPSNSLGLENLLANTLEEGCTVHVKQISQEVICD